VAEFLRRYEAMPEVKKAELIEGEVYLMASPVRIDQHGIPDHIVQMWLGVYAASTPGVRGATNSTVRLGPSNVPQPDGLLFRDASRGGKAKIGADGYLHGPPDLAVEVAASSASVDAGKKRGVYLNFGVQEYVLVRVRDGAVDWWSREDDEYIRIEPDEQGILRSRIFPGLWLDADALLDEDAARVLAVAQQGIASLGA
jgi:Uma2 family endonuclease